MMSVDIYGVEDRHAVSVALFSWFGIVTLSGLR